jgi:hypothetical protein
MTAQLLSFLPTYFQHDPLGLFLVLSAASLAASWLIYLLFKALFP